MSKPGWFEHVLKQKTLLGGANEVMCVVGVSS